MGFIPIFLTMGSALILFFLTVKNALQKKINFQKELLFKLKELNPELGVLIGKRETPEELIAILKDEKLKKGLATEALAIVKEMKINRHQYKQLATRAPYKWVAKLANFQSI